MEVGQESVQVQPRPGPQGLAVQDSGAREDVSVVGQNQAATEVQAQRAVLEAPVWSIFGLASAVKVGSGENLKFNF